MGLLITRYFDIFSNHVSVLPPKAPTAGSDPGTELMLALVSAADSYAYANH